MEIIKKVRRFAMKINPDTTKKAFDEKLRFLANPIMRKLGGSATERIQRQIAAIMLLRFLQEIKDYFDSSTAGHLIESFLGGLIPGKVPDDNGEYDIISVLSGLKYQVKLYTYKESIKYFPYKPTCDYYILGLKEHNKIHIWTLSKDVPEEQATNVEHFLAKGQGTR